MTDRSPASTASTGRPTGTSSTSRQRSSPATGYAGLLVDAPAALDLPGYYTWDAEKDIATWVASVTDLRRGLDLLETLPQIDAGRIGFMGPGYGGAMGAMLAGLDHRVKAFALAYVGGKVSTLGSWDTKPGGEQFFAAEGEHAAQRRRPEALRGADVRPRPRALHRSQQGRELPADERAARVAGVWREELDALIVDRSCSPRPWCGWTRTSRRAVADRSRARGGHVRVCRMQDP